MALPSAQRIACLAFTTMLIHTCLLTACMSKRTSGKWRAPRSALDLAGQEFVRTHNAARMEVGQNLWPMTWNVTLKEFALSWAQNQAWNKGCALEHSDGPYGENIFWASWTSSPGEAVGDWVAEKQYYDYDSNACSAPDQECGHYTQVVWRDSIRVGCASVACPGDGGAFTVCSYDPPGNWVGVRPY